MASNVSRGHIILSMNAQAAKDVLKALEKQAESTKAQLDVLKEAGQVDTKEYRALERELKSVQRAIRENEKDFVNLDEIVQNLATTTRGKLVNALKSAAREMNNMAEGSADLDKLKSQYEQITAQIKKLEVGYVNVEKIMQSLDTASEKTLRKALSQLRDVQSGTERGTQAWIRQEQQMKSIESTLNNMNRMDPNLVMSNLSSASVNDIKGAIAEMERLRNETVLGSSAWNTYNDKMNMAREYLDQFSKQQKMSVDVAKSMASGATPATVGQLKEAAEVLKTFRDTVNSTDAQGLEEVDSSLKKITEQLSNQQKMSVEDAIKIAVGMSPSTIGELKEATNVLKEFRDTLELTDTDTIKAIDDGLKMAADRLNNVQKELIDVAAVLADPKTFSPEKIRKAIAELNDQLNKMTMNDPRREGIRQQIQALNGALDETERQTVDVQQVLNNIKTASLDDLKMAAKQLEEEIGKAARNTDEYAKKSAEYARIKRQLDEVNKSWKEQDSTIARVAKRLAAYVGIYGVFNLIKNKLSEIVKENIKFSDTLSDIRKTSGLSSEAVNKLSESINKIDSRAGREELHALAYEAGRLGLGQYGAEGILGFVRASNQLSVALKEDLGQDAIVQLVKMADVMGDIRKIGIERSLMAVGSAINELSQSTTARGEYMTNYSRRLSGIASQAHITTAEIIGLGAASDATGQEVEVAATAMNKFIVQLQTHYKTVASAAGVSSEALHGLLEQGRTAEAVVMVLRALGEKGGLSQLAPLMKDMGSDGARLTASLATMATNVDKVEAAIWMAKDAFEEATSVTNEYNIKNENAAAILERMKNSWDKLFVNQANVGVLKQVAQDIADLSDSIQRNGVYMKSLEAIIWLLVFAFKAFVQLIPSLIAFLSFKGALAFASSFMILVKSIRTATMATGAFTMSIRVLTTAMKSNVFILVASVLASLAMKLFETKKEVDRVKTSMDKLKDSYGDFVSESMKARTEVDLLFARLKKTTSGTEEHRRAIVAINNKYGDYLDHLITERDTLRDIEIAQRKVNEEMLKSMAYKAKQTAIQSVGEDSIQKMAEAIKQIREMYNNLGLKDVGSFDISYITNRVRTLFSEGLDPDAISKAIIADLKKFNADMEEKLSSVGLLDIPLLDIETAMELGVPRDYQQKRAKEQIDLRKVQQSELQNSIKNLAVAMAQNAEEMRQVDEIFDPLIGDYVPKVETFQIDETEDEKKRKEALRIAKEHYQAVMSAIEVFYKQQEQVVNDEYLKDKITAEEHGQELTRIEENHLRTRIEARKKLHGDSNRWDEELILLSNSDLAKTENSMNALQNLISKNLDQIGETIRRFGEKTDDGIWKNLEEDFLQLQKISINRQRETEKILLNYDYTAQVTKQYQTQLEKLRIFLIDYGDITQEGFEGVQKKAAEGMKALLNISPDLYDIEINTDIGLEAFKQMITNSEAFGERMKELTDEEYQALYYKTLEYYDATTEAEKKAKDRSLKIAKERWERTQQFKDNELRGAKDKDTLGVYKAYEDIGLASPSMVQDQETLMYMNRLEAAKDFYNYLDAHGHPTEEAMLEIQKAASDLSEKLIESTKERLSRVREFGVSFENFGTAFGESAFVRGEEGLESRQKALENLVRGFGEATKQIILDWVKQQIEHAIIRTAMAQKEEEFREDMADSEKDGTKKQSRSIQSAGRTLLKETAKWGKNRLKAKRSEKIEEEQIEEESQSVQGTIATEGTAAISGALMDMGNQVVQAKKTQAAENISTSATEATANTSLGIASGAAQTIGELGWWGIPLVAVITALLSGLLSAAMGKVSGALGGSKGGGAAINTKLVTGMLTYDSGNVQAVGNDGHTYSATHVDRLSTGLVTSPIATTVGGEPALIAERGPEMIIGRETTKAMMMSRPDLLDAIVKFDKNRSGRTYKAYDAGNVGQFGGHGGMDTNGEESLSLEDAIAAGIEKRMSPILEEVSSLIRENTQVNAGLSDRLDKGITAKISKNGKGGLMDEVISGLYDAKRTGSNDKVKRILS